MATAKGVWGSTLAVDLSNGTSESLHMDDHVYSEFIGGRGLGIKLLMDISRAGVDPLSPDNPMIFMTGPFTGAGVFSAFFNVTTKAPLTGIAASSHCGGKWGPKLKRTGVDGIIIKGVAENPCYILVDEEAVSVREGKDLWGKGTLETERMLKQQLGDVEVLAIGQAGENQVRFASIMNGHRALGRGGVGAVMGSKKLKAIAVRGKMPIQVNDHRKTARISSRHGKIALVNGKNLGHYGSSMGYSFLNEHHMLPTKYFREGYHADVHLVDASALKQGYFVKDRGCFQCPLKCGNVHSIKKGSYRLEEVEGPEYETIMAFGSNCGNSNLESILMANYLCNDFGLDTISCGNTIAYLMDLFDLGIIDADMLDGLSLSWGNHQGIVSLIPKIARREGIGDLMAQGSREMAKTIGGAAVSRLIQIKGQDFPGYESRRSFGTGFSLATSNRGADHLRAMFYIDEVLLGVLKDGDFEAHVDLLLEKEHLMTIIDSLCICKFGQRAGEFTWPVLTDLFSALTGIDCTEHDMRLAGERIWNLERLYNLREGVEEDMLPLRFFNEDLADGFEGGKKVPKDRFIKARDQYYRLRGWSEKGEPGSAKLEELGLA